MSSEMGLKMIILAKWPYMSPTAQSGCFEFPGQLPGHLSDFEFYNECDSQHISITKMAKSLVGPLALESNY
jgi:hypothetical protein